MIQNSDETGTLDATEEGILDLLVSKHWAIKLATETARTVLSVDQIIVSRQAGGPKPPAPNPVSCCPANRLIPHMISLNNNIANYFFFFYRTGMRTNYKIVDWSRSRRGEGGHA